MNRVAVIMSTYNGELYVREQIESLVNQRGADVSIYIRDDGSTDGTIEIVRKMAKAFPIFFCESKNIGVGNSFMQLLYDSPDNYDYYAFCDQDDIWGTTKIAEAISLLNKTGKQLYTSNLNLVDKNGNFECLKYGTAPRMEKVDILQRNPLYGCTMVFTQEFKKLVTDRKRRPSEDLLRIRIHDVWLAMVGVVTKSIVYDSNAYIAYRQHETNFIGGRKLSYKTRLKQKYNKFKDSTIRHGRSLMAQEIESKYGDYLESNDIIRICADYQNSIHDKLHLMQNYKAFSTYNGAFIYYSYVIFGLF